MKNNFQKDWEELLKHWNDVGEAYCYELTKRFISKYPNNSAGWIVYADLLWGFARYTEAYKALMKAKKYADKKKMYFIYFEFGHFYREKCDLKRAEEWYRKSVKEKALSGNLIFLGACLAKQGKFSEAKRCYYRSIKVNTQPSDEAYFNLGLLARSQSKYEDAKKYFEKAIKIDPNYRIAKDKLIDVKKVLKNIKKREWTNPTNNPR